MAEDGGFEPPSPSIPETLQYTSNQAKRDTRNSALK